MNYTRTHTMTWGTYAVMATSGILLCLILLYVVLVFKTVSFTAFRQHATTDISDMTVRVGELETQFIALKNNITNETAVELGFEEVSAKRYISKSSLGLSRRDIR